MHTSYKLWFNKGNFLVFNRFDLNLGKLSHYLCKSYEMKVEQSSLKSSSSSELGNFKTPGHCEPLQRKGEAIQSFLIIVNSTYKRHMHSGF